MSSLPAAVQQRVCGFKLGVALTRMHYVDELLQRLMKEMFVHVCERDCVYTHIYLSLTPAHSRLLILHCKLY